MVLVRTLPTLHLFSVVDRIHRVGECDDRAQDRILPDAAGPGAMAGALRSERGMLVGIRMAESFRAELALPRGGGFHGHGICRSRDPVLFHCAAGGRRRRRVDWIASALAVSNRIRTPLVLAAMPAR